MDFSNKIRHLTLKPFSQETEQGRTDERYRLALLAMLANFASKAMSMLLMVLSVNWTLPYLGAERFGVWMTVASFAGMLSFMDLGIGNALTNRVTHAASSGSKTILQETISGGLGILFIISVLLAVILTCVASLVSWESVIKLQTIGLKEELKTTIVVFSLLFSITILTNGVIRVFHGLQRGYEANLIGILGALLAIIALRIAVNAKADLPLLLLCSMGIPIFSAVILFVMLNLRDQFSTTNLKQSIISHTPLLVRSGGVFFLLQIGTMVGWGADSLIIANASGAASVAAFSVAQRLMQVVSQPLAIMNAPLWGAYADADAKNDKAFIKRTFKKSMLITFTASSIGAICMFYGGNQVINVWTKSEMVISKTLILAMAIWLILEATGNALGILLNGLGIVKQQLLIVTVFIITVLPLKFYWVTRFEAIGVVFASIIVYILITIIGYGIIFRKKISKRMK